MNTLQIQGKARDILNAMELGGNAAERAVYEVVQQRQDLTEQILWAAAKYIARVIREDRPGFKDCRPAEAERLNLGRYEGANAIRRNHSCRPAAAFGVGRACLGAGRSGGCALWTPWRRRD